MKISVLWFIARAFFSVLHIMVIIFFCKLSVEASSSCDGSVRVWNIDDQKPVKELTGFQRSNDISTSKVRCRIAWDKTGKVSVSLFDSLMN